MEVGGISLDDPPWWWIWIATPIVSVLIFLVWGVGWDDPVTGEARSVAYYIGGLFVSVWFIGWVVYAIGWGAARIGRGLRKAWRKDE